MKQGLIYVVWTVMLLVFFRVGSADVLDKDKLVELGFLDPDQRVNDFRKALSESDILACRDSVAPLWEKACRDGYFRDAKKFDTVGGMVANRILDARIDREDPELLRRFESMEYFFRQIVYCDVIAQTNIYFRKLADYLADESVISLTNQAEETELARKKDQALIESGAIERPFVIIGRAHTPNLVALRIKHDRIKSWNGKLNNHRLRVASIFSERMTQYLQSLKKEDAEAFRKLFTERAGLSKTEESIFFPKREEGK